MTFRKKNAFLFLIILLVCVYNQTSSAIQLENKRQVAETYLKEEIIWLQAAASQNKQTDIRLRQASSQLIKSLAIWHKDGQLLFPKRELTTRVYDYLFLNNQHRIKKLLEFASPTAWELYDVDAEALFYCRQDTISVCLLVDTNELITTLGIPKEELFTALFPANKQTISWWLYILYALLLAILLVAWYKLSKRETTRSKTITNNTFKMGDMLIDPQCMSITRDNFTANITERDLKILLCLIEHPDEVLTKDTLYNAGWGRSYVPNSRSLEQHIMTLRKKIDPSRQLTSLIETVHGHGYRYPASQL